MPSAAPDFDYAAHGLRPPERRPEIPGGPQTVVEVLDRALESAPEREALVGRHGRYSYAELDRAANRAAHALRELGVAPGDRVAACLPNDADIVVAFLGAMRLGAVWVGVNRPLAPPEKAYLLADSGASLLLATPQYAEQVEGQRADLPQLGRTVLVDHEGASDEWAELLARAPDAPRPDVAIDAFAPAAISYTSGTTGHPKGAVHSQHNLLLPGAVTRWQGRYPDMRIGVVLPLTTLNLIVLYPLVAFQLGNPCVAIDRTDALGLAEWVREERIDTLCGVPTILHDLLMHPDVKPEDLKTLVEPEVGGAVCPEEFLKLYRERFGREVSIGYGMTEAPTAVTWTDGTAPPVPGLCGKARPQVEIHILDEQGRRLPPGEAGEICVAPATTGDWAGIYTPMLGYWKRPEATEEALRFGVYHTGDLGFVAEDGNLFIRGRRSELILRGGANVYPAEVERVIQADPRVAEAAVLGVPDPRLGERVVAVVQLERGATASPEELLARCRAELARYKVPAELRIVQELPRNAMAKVVKPKLRPLFEGGGPAS